MQTPVWVMSTARSPLNHKEGAELKKQHKAESWEVESHTHTVCWLARTVIFNTMELRGSVRGSQEVQTILLAAGTTIK